MILVRDVLKIAPDCMKEAKEMARQQRELAKRQGHPEMLIMTDLAANFYTLVFESRFDSLSHYEESMKRVMTSKEWQKLYPKLRKCIRGGQREIFSIVD
jgi:hypothetical protein